MSAPPKFLWFLFALRSAKRGRLSFPNVASADPVIGTRKAGAERISV